MLRFQFPEPRTNFQATKSTSKRDTRGENFVQAFRIDRPCAGSVTFLKNDRPPIGASGATVAPDHTQKTMMNAHRNVAHTFIYHDLVTRNYSPHDGRLLLLTQK